MSDYNFLNNTKYDMRTNNNIQLGKYNIPMYKQTQQITPESNTEYNYNLMNQENNIDSGLTKNLNSFAINSPINYNGMKLYQLGNNVTDEQLKQLGDNYKTITLGNNKYLVQDQSFLDKYGTGIKLGLGAGQLGLGIASFIENRATMKDQRKVLKEQLREAKEEYNRIKQTRNKLNASY